MASPPEAEHQDRRSRVRERLSRFGRRSQSFAKTARVWLSSTSNHGRRDLLPTGTGASAERLDVSAAGENESLQVQAVQVDDRRELPLDSPTNTGSDRSTQHLDLWSDAFREAVTALEDQIDIALLKGKHVEQLFKELEQMGKEGASESVFLRGLKRLKSIQVPLERFKIALDLASPLTSLEPTVKTAFGVVTSVTAIAISLASIDVDFAKQIGDMLEQISYIDDCDTLGQKAHKQDIHKALVSVYKKLLEFYKAAFEIITKKGAKLVMKIVLEKDLLPELIQDFLQQAKVLQKLVQKATWEIAEDIKEMLYDREISRWLGGEKTSRQSAHHAMLRDIGDDQACVALLTDHDFISWYNAPDSDQLAILGDTGCGKTVTAAYIVDELGRRSRFQLPRPKLCYHYCQDDETGEAAYVLSTLILSLLQQLPGLKKDFVNWYQSKQAVGNFEPATSRRQLEGFLEEILKSLDRPLFIVLDGLDECSRESRTQVLNLFEMLSKRSCTLKTLLTSRPDQETLKQLAGSRKIQLLSDKDRDSAIALSTIARRLPFLADDARALLVSRLSTLAQGSAIWTKMVVELIATREINALSSLQSFLERMPLPGQLSSLYDAMIYRCASNDSENLELAAIALGVLSAARRPLSILELSWAVAMGSAPQSITTVEDLAKRVDHQRILRLIRPFIASIDFSEVKIRQVRLVHQSVKEFVRAKSVLDQHGAEVYWKVLVTGEAACLDEFVLDICIRYLLLEEVGRMSFFSENQTAMNELPEELDLFSETHHDIVYDPKCTWEVWEEAMIHFDPNERGFGEFFVYASCQWVEHFKYVVSKSSSRLKRIEQLCYKGSTRLDNWIQQNRRPSCAVQPRFEFESSLYDPLSITSLYGSSIALQHMLTESNFDDPSFHYGTVAKAAHQILQWGDLSRLSVLLSHQRSAERFRWVEIFRLIIDEWRHHRSRHHDWDLAFELIDEMSSDELSREHSGNELLCTAAEAGCLPVIERLMAKAGDDEQLRHELLLHVDETEGRVYSSALQAASHQGHDKIVVMLLAHGADVNAQDGRYGNVLHAASVAGHHKIVKMLLDNGAAQGDDHKDDEDG